MDREQRIEWRASYVTKRRVSTWRVRERQSTSLEPVKDNNPTYLGNSRRPLKRGEEEKEE